MVRTCLTLNPNPLATGTVPVRRRPSFFPASQVPSFSGDLSVNVRQNTLLLWKLRSIPAKPIKACEQSNQGDGVEDKPSVASSLSKLLKWAKPLVLRESFRGLADFADRNRKLLSVMSAILLSLVPWIQVSRSRSLLLMVKPAVFLVAVGMGLLLHFILLAFNALGIQSLSAISGGSKSMFAKKQNANALLLVASQKTLPVMQWWSSLVVHLVNPACWFFPV